MSSPHESTESVSGRYEFRQRTAAPFRSFASRAVRPLSARILALEPRLRHSIPFLIILFIATNVVGAGILEYQIYQSTIRSSIDEMEAITARLAFEIGDTRTPEHFTAATARQKSESLPGRRIMLALLDASGQVIASSPQSPKSIDEISYILGAAKPASGGRIVTEVTLQNGARVLVGRFGSVASVQYLPDALEKWSSIAQLITTLFSVSGVVILVLGFAFHWQANRAREADDIYRVVRNRIELALIGGTCGLWDWNVSSGQLYWSKSMFDCLGFKNSSDLIGPNELQNLVHPADTGIAELISKLDEGNTRIDLHVRLRHAAKGWTTFFLRLRRFVDAMGQTHLLGIALEEPGGTLGAPLALKEHNLDSTDPSSLYFFDDEAPSQPSELAQGKSIAFLVRVFACGIFSCGFGALLMAYGFYAGGDSQFLIAGSGLVALGASASAMSILSGETYVKRHDHRR